MNYKYTFLLLLSISFLSGCEFPEAPEQKASEQEESTDSDSSDKEPPLYLGNMLKKFKAPTWEQLNADIEKQGGWTTNPLQDSAKLTYQYLNGKPAPTTVEKALTLENTSPENNEKIRYTLGRLPENEQKEVDYEAVHIRQSPVDAKSANPLLMSSSTEFELYALLGFGILSHTYDTMESYAPKEFVSSWQTSPDLLCDKFVLRDDLIWSDGKPVTAYDIEFSFKLIMTRQIPIPAMRSGTNQIKAAVAYDDRTIVFFHNEALVTNVMNMNFGILPKHIYEKSWKKDTTLSSSRHHVEYETHPVVAGPYRIVDRKSDQFIELERREDFYMYNGKQVRDKPYFKKIRIEINPASETALMALKRGDLDYMQIDFNQWNSQTKGEEFYNKCTKVQAVEWTSFHFNWNIKTPFFEDVRVRKAMSYAFDYKEMFDVILFNLAEPSYGIFHPLNPAFPKDAKPPYQQDLSKSIALLTEAGWIDHDGDGVLDKYFPDKWEDTNNDGKPDKCLKGGYVPFDFTLYVNNASAIGLQICELMQQNLKGIGVICNVRPIEYTTLQQKCDQHQFQASLGGWGTGTDPDTSENIWGTGADRNFGYFSDPEVDRLFKLGKREKDRKKRMEIYGKIHNIIYEQQPYTFLYCRNSFYAVSKRIRGYGFYPRGIIDGNIWVPKENKD